MGKRSKLGRDMFLTQHFARERSEWETDQMYSWFNTDKATSGKNTTFATHHQGISQHTKWWGIYPPALLLADQPFVYCCFAFFSYGPLQMRNIRLYRQRCYRS